MVTGKLANMSCALRFHCRYVDGSVPSKMSSFAFPLSPKPSSPATMVRTLSLSPFGVWLRYHWENPLGESANHVFMFGQTKGFHHPSCSSQTGAKHGMRTISFTHTHFGFRHFLRHCNNLYWHLAHQFTVAPSTLLYSHLEPHIFRNVLTLLNIKPNKFIICHNKHQQTQTNASTNATTCQAIRSKKQNMPLQNKHLFGGKKGIVCCICFWWDCACNHLCKPLR